jgi:primosomal protein N' (replication factor Y)
MASRFADIILPLAVKGRFTYRIPDNISGKITLGVRVLVQFGNKKLYSGIVGKLHNDPLSIQNIRSVIDVLDTDPLVNEIQLKFWQWISEYYMCTEGEVVNAALPSAFCLEGSVSEKVKEKYKPRKETFIELNKMFTEKELNKILDDLSRAPKQYEILSAWLRITGYTGGSGIKSVRKSSLLKETGSSPGALEALIGKSILSSLSLEVGRLEESEPGGESLKILSSSQAIAYNSICSQLKEKNIVLLHGVTSSGKTEIYIHLIEEQLKLGKQILYLLPEIGLTAQIILRLRKHFGKVTGVYHSRFNDQERVEIWKRVGDNNPDTGYRLILGVRSALFLPFSNLGLIIVDEEHDGSYKQHDPAPRYHARDSALVLASMFRAKTILGSASPSIESYNNAVSGKYGLAELHERFGKIRLPVIILADTREAYRKKLMISHFTPQLLQAMDEALGKGEQIILFQNRRGFSPYIECSECGWIPVCNQCAVNLTYHKRINRLLCHYCGYSTGLPAHCGNCQSTGLTTRGFGTEKIEDEIRIVFPKVKVDRMDQDTTKGKNSVNRIISDFEERQIDILIGTQMISKGLDFENLTVVGILNADNMLNYPDFRAHERSFQLMEQVSGRAGRRLKQGKVIIQTSDPSNKIIRMMLRHDYKTMFRMQTEERKAFNYPPFFRMIKINLKHKDRAILNTFSEKLTFDLRSYFGKRVLGPEYPIISKIQLWYIKTIIIKIEKEKPIVRAKQYINGAIGRIEKEKGAGSLKIAVDVDPY